MAFDSVATGADTGYHMVKVAFTTGQFSFPSQVATPPVGYGRADLSISKGVRFHMEEPYNLLVGEAAQLQRVGQPNLSPEWFRSPGYFALVASALAGSSNLMDEKHRVVMGLPVSYMGLKDELERLLNGVHRVKFAGSEPQLMTLKVTVVAQGVGALACSIINRDGTISRENAYKLERPQDCPQSGVLDIGAGTACFVLANGLKTVANGTSSIDTGAWAIERIARGMVIDAYGADLIRGMPPHQLLHALRTGTLRDAGRVVDTSAIFEKACELVANSIIEQVRGVWPVRTLDDIVITGGGGMLMAPWITRAFPQAHLLDEVDPVFANAEGYLRIAQMLLARGA